MSISHSRLHETQPGVELAPSALPAGATEEYVASVEIADGLQRRRDVHANKYSIGRVLGISAVAMLAVSLLQGSEAPANAEHVDTHVPVVATRTAPKTPAVADNLNIGRAQHEWKQFIEKATAPLNPESFTDGQHVGAFIIDYKYNPNRPWGLIDAFYNKRGLKRPAMNNPMVHRMIAGLPSDKNLASGPVLDPRSTSSLLVAGMHDVTPVHAPEAVNAKVGKTNLSGVYKQTQMGINAVLMPGDVVHIVQPTQREGWVVDRTYTMVGKYILDMYKTFNGKKVLNQQGINDLFTKPSAEEIESVLRIYQCWEPGSDKKRLVYELKATGTNVYRGDVEPVGKAKPSGHNL